MQQHLLRQQQSAAQQQVRQQQPAAQAQGPSHPFFVFPRPMTATEQLLQAMQQRVQQRVQRRAQAEEQPVQRGSQQSKPQRAQQPLTGIDIDVIARATARDIELVLQGKLAVPKNKFPDEEGDDFSALHRYHSERECARHGLRRPQEGDRLLLVHKGRDRQPRLIAGTIEGEQAVPCGAARAGGQLRSNHPLRLPSGCHRNPCAARAALLQGCGASATATA